MPNDTVFYLEMTEPSQLQGKPSIDQLDIRYCKIKQWAVNKFLYEYVGGPWSWTDKHSETDEQWQSYVEDKNLHTWIAYYQGAIAGYFEMQQQKNGDVELVYFGLTPDFLGKGLGGYMLTYAIKQAWQLPNTKRIWLHTCNLDHPSAKANYEARGFIHYKTEKESCMLD